MVQKRSISRDRFKVTFRYCIVIAPLCDFAVCFCHATRYSSPLAHVQTALFTFISDRFRVI